MASAACASEGEEHADGEDLLAPGAYEVGFRELEFEFQPVVGVARSIPVRVWYPADADSGAPAAVYSLGGLVEIPTGSALDDPPPSAHAPFPVAVYSHGSGGDGLVGYPFAELFASHGWGMVARNHIGKPALDGLSMTEDPVGQIVADRPPLVSATLDWLETSDLGSVSDTERVVVIGQSFGGYSALASAGAKLDLQALRTGCTGDECAEYDDPAIAAAIEQGGADPRIVAAVPQAPGLIPAFGDGELGRVSVPVMLQSGRLDQTTTHSEQAAPAWAALAGADDVWIDMLTGAHMTFIRVCDDLDPALLQAFRPGADADGCGPEFIPVSAALPTLGAYMLAFARTHVFGEFQWRDVIGGASLHPDFEVLLRD